MNATAPVLPGETLAGKYRVERVLGRGGMGIVVTARHLELDERVAIKFLVGEPSQVAVDRFLREGRAAVKVKGEHVCRVFDFGRLEETGEPYIVMEHLEGTDLARKLDRDGPQPAEAVVGWMIEACDALAEAHALGIVHRDLKPANVFLANRPDGSTCAKVLDFGISKLPKAETFTQTAAIMGSPVYMSPEQMESARDVDARSDVWSLGVMLYELIAGAPPFVAESMVQLAVKVRENEPRPIRELVPDVPELLVIAIGKCLAKKPGARYASVAELATALAPLAPPEVSAVAMRLSRRLVALHAESGLELAATARHNDPPATTAESRGEASVPTVTSDLVARARGTFAPLQSTMGEPPAVRARRRRSSILAGLLALCAIAFAGSAVFSSKDATSTDVTKDAAERPPLAALPTSAPDTTLDAAGPTSAAPPTTAPTPPVPLASSSSTADVREPVVSAPRRSPVVHAPSTATATAAPVATMQMPVLGTGAATSTQGPTTPPPRSGPEPRKPRELDRDDP